jgi:hypothetical protein
VLRRYAARRAEHAGPDLQQLVGARGASAHLLFLHRPLADDLSDGGFNEAGRDRLAVPLLQRSRRVLRFVTSV